MGAYLAKPKTEKISEGNDNGKVSYGVSCMQGWRVTMEVKFYMRNKMAFSLRLAKAGKDPSFYFGNHRKTDSTA